MGRGQRKTQGALAEGASGPQCPGGAPPTPPPRTACLPACGARAPPSSHAPAALNCLSLLMCCRRLLILVTLSPCPLCPDCTHPLLLRVNSSTPGVPQHPGWGSRPQGRDRPLLTGLEHRDPRSPPRPLHPDLPPSSQMARQEMQPHTRGHLWSKSPHLCPTQAKTRGLSKALPSRCRPLAQPGGSPFLPTTGSARDMRPQLFSGPVPPLPQAPGPWHSLPSPLCLSPEGAAPAHWHPGDSPSLFAGCP